MVLVGDVGGTRTRLALAEKVHGSVELGDIHASPTTPDFAEKIVRFLDGRKVEAAAFGAAGPPDAERAINLTNANLRLVPSELARAAGVSRVVLVNDFRAIAEGVPQMIRGVVPALDDGP